MRQCDLNYSFSKTHLISAKIVLFLGTGNCSYFPVEFFDVFYYF